LIVVIHDVNVSLKRHSRFEYGRWTRQWIQISIGCGWCAFLYNHRAFHPWNNCDAIISWHGEPNRLNLLTQWWSSRRPSPRHKWIHDSVHFWFIPN
jgi:hypothetical protein